MRVASVTSAALVATLATAAYSAQVKWEPLAKPAAAKPIAPPQTPPQPVTSDGPAAAPVEQSNSGSDSTTAAQPITRDLLDFSHLGAPGSPDRATGISMIEEAVKATLKDPDSAEFRWPNGFVSGWYKPLLRHRFSGWITCGLVNAKNSYGGYVGYTPVIGVISNGQVIETDMDDATARYGGFVGEACKKIGVPVQ